VIRRITVQSQLGQRVLETLSQKKNPLQKNWTGGWLKVKGTVLQKQNKTKHTQKKGLVERLKWESASLASMRL
jgi:hypothetical protein